MLRAAALQTDNVQVVPITAQHESFRTELVDAVELEPGKIGSAAHVNAARSRPSLFHLHVGPGDCLQILAELPSRPLDAAGQNRQFRDAFLDQCQLRLWLSYCRLGEHEN